MARGSLAPGSRVEELARFLPFSLFPRPCLYPALHRSQNPGIPRPTSRVQRLDKAGSGFPRVLLSLSGSPPPPSRRLVPRARTAREPGSPSTQRALGPGGSASPPGEGCRGQSGSHYGHSAGYCQRLWTLQPQPAEPLSATPAADTRPQTNGPGGRRRPQGERRALRSPGVTPSAPGPRPEPPTILQKQQGPLGPKPLKSNNKTNTQIFTSDFKAGEPKAFHRFPSSHQEGRGGSSVPAGRSSPSARPLSWPAPPALEGPAPGTPGLSRLGARGDPGGPAFLPVTGTGADLRA